MDTKQNNAVSRPKDARTGRKKNKRAARNRAVARTRAALSFLRPELKLKGGASGKPHSELTRLKALWRKMPEEERAGWEDLLYSDTSRAQFRAMIGEKLGVTLKHDTQFTRFRKWVNDQHLRDLAAEEAQADAEELIRQGIRGDKLRAELLRRMKARATVRNDFKLGATALNLDFKAEQLAINKRRMKLLERQAELHEHAQAQQKEASESKGGISPETLAKIEAELGLFDS